MSLPFRLSIALALALPSLARAADDLVAIPGGTFAMGNTFAGEGSADELPVHGVTLPAFRIGRTEVTWQLWQEVRDWAVANGYPDLAGKGFGQAPDHPVISVSWHDAVIWCNARSERDGRTPVYYTTAAQTTVYRAGVLDLTSAHVRASADGYRLPTEAEWERAARGGVAGRRFANGDTLDHTRATFFSSSADAFDLNALRDRANPAHTSLGFPFTAPATAYAPNSFGLHGIAGNALEWCWDRYSSTYYVTSPTNAPAGPDSGLQRVLRGGSWDDTAAAARVARREADRPTSPLHGFRVAQNVVPQTGAPIIVQGPADVAIAVGETAVLTVVATGDGPLTYTWTRDGAAVMGASTAQLTLTHATAGMSGVYRATVANASGSALSDGAIVSVGGHSTYESWALGLGLLSPDPQADADGDGLSNLLEYALGFDPESPDNLTWFELRFLTGTALGLVGDDAIYAVLEAPTNPLATGVAVDVQMTALLQDWTGFPNGMMTHAETQRDGRTWRTFRSTQPCGPNDLPRFFRLRVTR